MKSRNSETKCLDFSQVHIEQFFAISKVFKGLCGEISILSHPTDLSALEPLSVLYVCTCTSEVQCKAASQRRLDTVM